MVLTSCRNINYFSIWNYIFLQLVNTIIIKCPILLYFMNSKLYFVASKSLLKSAYILEMLLGLTKPAWITEYSVIIPYTLTLTPCKWIYYCFKQSKFYALERCILYKFLCSRKTSFIIESLVSKPSKWTF